MKDTTTTVIHLDDDDATTELLHALGIRATPANGFSETDIDEDGIGWRSIGNITVHPCTGIIETEPHHDSTPDDLAILRGAAALAFREPPTENLGWGRTHDGNETVWRTLFFGRVG